MQKFVKFLKDEEGMVSVEYALIATLVALALVTALTFLGSSVSTKLSKVGSQINQ